MLRKVENRVLARHPITECFHFRIDVAASIIASPERFNLFCQPPPKSVLQFFLSSPSRQAVDGETLFCQGNVVTWYWRTSPRPGNKSDQRAIQIGRASCRERV